MTQRTARSDSSTRRAAALPGFLYGIGLGGFVDGIVLHQILQWHHLVSHTDDHPTTTVAGLEANTLADGLFHVVSWLVVVAACVVTMRQWRAGRFAPSWRFHLGAILAGWGVFNLVEGVIDHHVLGIHHVRDDVGAPLVWDLGFLALGVVLVGGGWLLTRADRSTATGPERGPGLTGGRGATPGRR